MKRRVAELLIICILAGAVAWGAAARENTAKAVKRVGSLGTGYMNVVSKSTASSTWTEPYSTGGASTTVQTMTVPKGTKCGKISVMIDWFREDRKTSYQYNDNVYLVYNDELVYTVTVCPEEKVRANVTIITTYLGGSNKIESTGYVYPASELLKVDVASQWAFGTQMTSGMMASYPYQPEGGICITDYTPKKNVSGSSSYNVFLSFPFSIGTTIDMKWDYLQVIDRTQVLGGRKYGVSFDYKKWAAGNKCDKGRQQVVFGPTTQQGGFSWRTTDQNYKLPVVFEYSMTLCRGNYGNKSVLTAMSGGTFSTTITKTCEWK